MLSAMATAVYLESGSKRVFACALDWPGWCRSGKTEGQALAALATYAPRYAAVAGEARLAFPNGPTSGFDVVERIKGSSATDFGVPEREATHDREPLSRQEAERLVGLLAASWTVFDRVVAAAPPALRKGPRGGGRDRDDIREHVIGAESMYARKMGIPRQPALGDGAAVAATREAILEAVRGATGTPRVPDKGWPVRYAVRREAWHVLDHAWEMEDRSA